MGTVDDEQKATNGKRGEERESCRSPLPSQVTNFVKNGSADKRRNVGSGAQWRIENDTQTCIVPATTSGIVKYDRLLVK